MANVIHPGTSIDYDVAPGTVYIVSTDDEHTGQSHVRLIPHPSDDIQDPLRWQKWRKYYHLCLLVAYSTVMGAVTNWESPIYLVIVDAYHTDLSTLNIGSAVLILMLGVGNVFLTPLSHKLGRRCIYLMSLLLAIITYVWLVYAHTPAEYVAAHFLLGIAAAPFEALPAISIADVFFAHERGTMMGCYVFGLALGSFVGPICCGYIFPAMGFRWVYKWGAIIQAALFVIMYFTFEESHFVRPAGEEASNSADEAINAAAINRVQQTAKSVDADVKDTEDDLGRTISYHQGQMFNSDSFKIQWKPYRVFPGTFKQYRHQCFQPLMCFWFPAVLWTGINYGTCVSWLAVLGTTTASILAPPPYLFGTDALGLIWLAPLLGSILGAIYSGPFNDKFALWLARRNRGWREPEYRLWAFIPGAVIMPAGLMLYGVGAAAGLPWIVPVFGMGMIGFGLSIGGTVAISYIIDSYRDIDGEAVTTVIMIRNIIGFGVTFGIQQWIEGMGLRNCFIMIGCLSCFITGFAGVFVLFGKRWRKLTERTYKRMATARA